MSWIPTKTVSDLLGHCNEATTLREYSHAMKNMDSQAAEVIEDIITTGKLAPRFERYRSTEEIADVLDSLCMF